MRKRTLSLLFAVAVSLAAIYLAVVGVDFRSVWDQLARANLGLLALALASIGLNNALKAWRWKLLLGERGVAASFWRLLHLHLVGQLLNQILPARAGDLSRVYLAGHLGVARAYVLGTLAVEKTIDLVCYVLIGLLLLVVIPLPEWVSRPAYALALTTAVALVALALAARFGGRLRGLEGWLRPLLPARLRQRAAGLLDDGLASLRVMADPRLALKIGLLSALVWVTAVLTNYLVMLALGIGAPPVAAAFVLFVLLVGVNIASVPGQIGVFQYLCILALAVFQVGQASALSFGVLLQLLVLLPMAIAGLAALWGFGPPLPVVGQGTGESPQS